MVTHSATLAANERVRARIAAGEEVVHLAFGEAGLPVHPALAAVLADAADRTDYPPVAGDEEARAACARYFGRRGITASADRVLLAPGSKALLYASLAAVPGDVLLPRPSWVSYAAQAALAHKNVIDVPIPAHTGGIPDPGALADVIASAKAAGADPGLLVLTRPDNPTGTVAPDEDIKAICEIAEQHDLCLLSDEIYGDTVHDGQPGPYPVSPSTLAPDRTIVTTGFSKRLALGGWRIGIGLLPAPGRYPRLRDQLVGIGSEIWSAMSAPMQNVVTYAADEPAEMVAYVDAARRLHGAVSTALWRILRDAGVSCRRPQGAFYLYPDFGEHRDALAATSITTSGELADALLDRYGIAVLAGEAFGDDPENLTCRMATSLLYGTDPEQRRTALSSADPAGLPWIAAALSRVAEGMAHLLHP